MRATLLWRPSVPLPLLFIIFLIITLFNGVSIGANYMAARDFGAQDNKGLFRTVHCAALLSVILGLLACVCGLLLSTPLLRWADAPEDVLPLSALYLRIYFLGVPALVVYNFGSALLRAVGDTFYPLLFMIVSGALNVALNLLLVVVIPLDVAGVAIATSVSQLLSAVLVTVRLCTFRGPCRLDLRKIRLYPDRTGQMLRLGFSAGLQGIKDFILETVEAAGPNPCPPIVVGVGIGGTFDKAALLAKKALMRPLDTRNPDPFYADLEKEMLEKVNALGIGPQGFGGRTTAIGLNIETMPTHIAGMPCAININCHVTRHKTEVL